MKRHIVAGTRSFRAKLLHNSAGRHGPSFLNAKRLVATTTTTAGQGRSWTKGLLMVAIGCGGALALASSSSVPLSCAAAPPQPTPSAAASEGLQTGSAPPSATQGSDQRKRLVILGSGWAALSVLRHLDTKNYDVVVVSPRNYFLFTPLLPSVTVGTLEARRICKSIRWKGWAKSKFYNAKCTSIDPTNQTIKCQETSTAMAFELPYDYLVVAVGCNNATFGTPGVEEHCHFLKELPDAQKIRQQIVQNLELASLPGQPEEEIKRLLHFVVVGGGPTGVEFAAELHDFLEDDLNKWFPKDICERVRITVIQSAEHILNTYDAHISDYAEKRFSRSGIDIKPLSRVVKVERQQLIYADKTSGRDHVLPYGLCLWATGVGRRGLVDNFCKQIKEQTNRRAILTDSHFRVLGTNNIFAVGDCATVEQKKLLQQFVELFDSADTNKDGVISLKELEVMVEREKHNYPQLAIYSAKLKDLFDSADKDHNAALDRDEFKMLLTQVDSNLKELPATAQVASQEGKYLAESFNLLANGKEPQSFEYKHLGSLAYIGGKSAVMELPGGKTFGGILTWFAWRGAYLQKQVSLRTKFMVAADWFKELVFGRDISRE